MTEYIINITNTSGEEGSILPDIGFRYTPEKLNDVGEAEIKVSSLGVIKRGLLEMGSVVEILRNGTREFYGLVDGLDNLKAGTVSFHASSWEIWMAKA